MQIPHSMPRPPVHVLGRFPPPLDGQSLATQRVATLLDDACDVRRVDINPGDSEHVQSDVRFRLGAAWHYVRMRQHIRSALAEAPEAPVLWNSMSPIPLGHVRDVLTVAPAFQPRQPVFAVMHRATLNDLFESSFTRWTAQRLLRRLDGFVFQSERLADRCAPWVDPERYRIIPNTVDDAVLISEEEIAAKRAGRRERDGLRLLFLSDMMPEKGYLDVLHAVALLHARGVPVEAEFAGRWRSETDRAAFDAFVSEHRLGSILRTHGGVDQQRVRALNLWADVFLLPTYHPTETQPKAILEALAAASPIISVRRGIIEDMVRDDREAVLVPPQDPASIADAVERLLPYATWHRISEGAYDRFQRVFSPDAVRPLWEDLVEKDRLRPSASRAA